jgi:hypothetical protein
MRYESKRARDLKLVLCDDWFIYMYDPETLKCYMYNTETMVEWLDVPNYPACTEEPNAVHDYMLPVVLKENRGLVYCDSIWNEQTHEMVYIGKD